MLSDLLPIPRVLSSRPVLAELLSEQVVPLGGQVKLESWNVAVVVKWLPKRSKLFSNAQMDTMQ